MEIRGGESGLHIQWTFVYKAWQGVALILVNRAFPGSFLSDQESFWFFSVCAGLFLALSYWLRVFLDEFVLGSCEQRFNAWFFLLSRGTPPRTSWTEVLLPLFKWGFTPWPWSRNARRSWGAFLLFLLRFQGLLKASLSATPCGLHERDPDGGSRWNCFFLTSSFPYLILFSHRSCSITGPPLSTLQQSVCFTTMALILFCTLKIAKLLLRLI